MKTDRKSSSGFNPLSWGMFFFTLWIVVRAISDLTTFLNIISWIFFSVSALSFLSIFVPLIFKLMDSNKMRSFVLPTIFNLTPLLFILGFLGNVLNVNVMDKNIALIFGVLWIIAWQLILVRLSGKYLGTGIAALYFYAGITVLVTGGDTWGGIFILLIGGIQVFVAFHIIPVIRLPIYDN